MNEKRFCTLYTLGYTGLKMDAIKDWLSLREALLVDVRMSGNSRNPAFTKNSFRAALGDYTDGGRYVYAGAALGNVNYKNGGPIKIANARAGVKRLLQLLEKKPLVLMCACPKHEECHRTTVADMVANHIGVDPVHLYLGKQRKVEDGPVQTGMFPAP